jgi:hypothetical protein
MTVQGPLFRYEVRRIKLGRRHALRSRATQDVALMAKSGHI